MPTQVPSYQERVKWFHEARFGMFIHWGLYSIPARGEWLMHMEHIPREEYAKLADEFNPARFDADAWAGLAKEAGAGYVVFTTRHHDGFCLFDSRVSDFTSVKTAAGRDFVADYVRAVRKAGLKVGLYYSLKDWRFDGYYDPARYPESAEAMIRHAHAQVRELLTNYGRIDLLWFDGAWVTGYGHERKAEFWRATELVQMARVLQPHILVNNRAGYRADIDSCEQRVIAGEPGRAWEACMTMGDAEGWGYVRHNPNYKSATELIQCLVRAAAGEGNLLLNIGPRPDGTVRREETDRVRAIGKWLAVNGESIYGSERCPFDAALAGLTTAKGTAAYVHVFRWPMQGEVVIPGVKNRVDSATVLGTDIRGAVEIRSNNRTVITGLPKTPPDPHDTVVKLVLDGKPEAGWSRFPDVPFTGL